MQGRGEERWWAGEYAGERFVRGKRDDKGERGRGKGSYTHVMDAENEGDAIEMWR